MIFGANRKPLLGLDISSTCVKLIELSGAAGKYRVEHYAVESLPPNSVVEKHVADVEAVGQAIARVVRKAGTKAKEAAVAVGGSAVITRYITMPVGLSESQLQQQVEIEAEQYIPFPMAEVNLDYEVVGPNSRDADQLDVLLAACRSDNVDARMAAVEIGGLTGRIVDLETFALENACSLLMHQFDVDDSAAVAVVDIGATTTSLTVLQHHRPVYTRDSQFGGQSLTEEIMRTYDLSYEEAGRMKREGGLPDDYDNKLLKPFVRDIAKQVERAIQLYQSATGTEQAVQQLILAGGCASIEHVDRVVQSETSIPTTIADPFAAMTVAPRARPQRLHDDAPSLMIAAGLAMRASK